MEYEVNTFYMKVYEKFTAKNGEPSNYTRMMGRYGCEEFELCSQSSKVTKDYLKERVEEILSYQTSLDGFTATEMEYGWKYERFIKWTNDGFGHEIVEEGQHSDHEVYEVHISYIFKDTDVFKKLL